MGAPVSIHEEEITTRDPLPQSHLRSPGALMQCVKMARLMAIVLSRELVAVPLIAAMLTVLQRYMVPKAMIDRSLSKASGGFSKV
jgi:hypothetical protein